jgi:hypothetical protein
MPKPTHEPTKNAPPVHEVRIGLIKAAIWANQTEDGIRHNVTFERSYRDGEDWKTTTSFGRDDLLALAKVADLAHSWIIQPERTTTRPNLARGRLPSAA